MVVALRLQLWNSFSSCDPVLFSPSYWSYYLLSHIDEHWKEIHYSHFNYAIYCPTLHTNPKPRTLTFDKPVTVACLVLFLVLVLFCIYFYLLFCFSVLTMSYCYFSSNFLLCLGVDILIFEWLQVGRNDRGCENTYIYLNFLSFAYFRSSWGTLWTAYQHCNFRCITLRMQ